MEEKTPEAAGGGGSVSRAGGRSRDANGFLTRNLSEKVAHRRIRTADHENGPPGIPARAPHLLSMKAERSCFFPEKQKRNVRESPSEEKRQPMEIRNYSKERRGRSGNHRRKRVHLSLVMRPSLR